MASKGKTLSSSEGKVPAELNPVSNDRHVDRALCRPCYINALNLRERGCKLCRFKNMGEDDAHGLSLSLSLSLSHLLHISPPSQFSPPSPSYERRRGIPRDYRSTRYYLQRTYVTFRTAYYCDYRRIMRRPSRSTIYY